jgi:hypothetical protein
VRIQWDPERDFTLAPLPHRAIQIGLGGEAAHRYVSDWIVRIDDVTDLAHDLHQLVIAGRVDDAADKLPAEGPYPLPERIRAAAGASSV